MKNILIDKLRMPVLVRICIIATLLALRSGSALTQPFMELENTTIDELPAPTFENVPVYRLQLRITTANVKDAGTDADIYVKLNGRDRAFYLDKARNDFERNKVSTYDILPANIKGIKDIEFFEFGLKGDDAICISKLELIVNDNRQPVYIKSYGNNGKWLDNYQKLTIPGGQLRSYAGWKYSGTNQNIWKSPEKLSRKTLIGLIEAAIGNEIEYQGDLAWGSNGGLVNTLFGDAVEVKFTDSKTLHVDLDLEWKVTGPNPEVDVDFDIVFECKNGTIKAEMRNIKSDLVGITPQVYQKVIDLGGKLVGNAIGGKVGSVVVSGLLSTFLDNKAAIGASEAGVNGTCVNVQLTRDCDLLLLKN